MGEQVKTSAWKEETKTEAVWQILLCIYLVMLFVIYPLFFKNKYNKMGDHKYEFYMLITIIFLLVSALLVLFEILCHLFHLWRIKEIHFKAPVFSALDLAMMLYGAAVVLSFAFSQNKGEALLGAEGWYMGAVTQLVMIASYFVISRKWEKDITILYLLLIASGVVYSLGILHRFRIDPLGMYQGLSEEHIIRFLSTIGQATWYSSYLCTLFPIGVFLFWYGKRTGIRIAAAVYCFLAFSTLVTQNSDSAFMAAGVVLLILLWVSLSDLDKMKRFVETILLMLASFVLMGTFQIVFASRAVALDGFSVFFSQSMFMWGIFAVVILLYFALLKFGEQYYWTVRTAEKIRKILYLGIAACLVCMVLFIYWNSTGILEKWIGITVHQDYLLFDEYWGNNRGFTWMFSVDMFKDFSPLQKLFGVGPDCFAAYAYSVPRYLARLNMMWGASRLTCAHNEIINTVICYGIVGAAAYLNIFYSAAKRFLKKRNKNAVVFSAVLCMASYLAHNFFCYQQIVCTPFLFVIFAMAEGICRKEKENENITM